MLQSITWAPWQSILSPVLSSTRSSSCNISNSELFLFLSLNFSFYHLVKKLSSSRQSSHFCFCPKPHINILTTKHLISVVFRCLCSSCVGVHDGTAPQLSESIFNNELFGCPVQMRPSAGTVLYFIRLPTA